MSQSSDSSRSFSRQPGRHVASARAISLRILVVGLALASTACATDSGTSGAVETGPREIKLAIGQGVVFTVGDVVPGASYLKVDLIVRKNGTSNFDLKPGRSSPSDSMAMNTFKTGGIPAIFKSLDAIKPKLPGAENYAEYLKKVKTGNGLVIQNNIGDAYTKVWVKQVSAASGQVTLEYELIVK